MSKVNIDKECFACKVHGVIRVSPGDTKVIYTCKSCGKKETLEVEYKITLKSRR